MFQWNFLFQLEFAIIAAIFTYFFVRRNDIKYKELPKTLTYSGFFRRLFASLIDHLIIIAVVLLVILIYGYKRSNIVYDHEYMDENFSSLMIMHSYAPIVFACFTWLFRLLYITLQQASSHQATIGMRFMGIRIYNAELNRADIWTLIGRDVILPLSAFPLFIGFLMIIWTRRNQGLHDKIAKTVVCRQW